MAVGGPSAWRFEVQWDGSTWTDETAYLLSPVTVQRGRSSDADDAQPAVLQATLDNTTGRFTPDSPLSPLWPNVRDGAPCRFSVTRSATTSSRYYGRLTVGEPDLPSGMLSQAQVRVVATDVLGDLARRTLRSDYTEQWLRFYSTGTAAVDMWPLDDDVSASSALRNLTGPLEGTVIQHTDVTGKVEQSTPDGIVVDGSVVLSPTGGLGAVVMLQSRQYLVGTVADIIVPFRTSARVEAGAADLTILCGWFRGTGQAFSVRLHDVSGRCDVTFHNASGSLLATLRSGHAAVGADSGDDQWFAFRMRWTGIATVAELIRIRDLRTLSSTTVAVDVRAIRTLVLGGQMDPRIPGKQTGCTEAAFGTVVMSTQAMTSWAEWLQPGAGAPSQTRLSHVATYAGVLTSITGTANRRVALGKTAGRTAMAVVLELARTVGAIATSDTAAGDTIAWTDSDAQRSPTVVLTLDSAQDVDGEAGFPWRKAAIPSRVTASYPGGEAVFVDGTQPLTIDASVETCAISRDGARDVAAALVNTSRRLRLTQLVVDVATASNDVWSTLMSMRLGSRIRVTIGSASSPLARHFGSTYVDVYAAGWVEEYGDGIARWTIDTVPADDPVEGVFGDAIRGRFGAADGSLTVTGGTALGTTSTGTIVVTTGGGLPLSAASGDYPMDLDWGGEVVTVDSAPASATSPQTLTLTARGVAPSIARVHAAGEPIDVHLPAAFTF